jgi:hypothetical protein
MSRVPGRRSDFLDMNIYIDYLYIGSQWHKEIAWYCRLTGIRREVLVNAYAIGGILALRKIALALDVAAYRPSTSSISARIKK